MGVDYSNQHRKTANYLGLVTCEIKILVRPPKDLLIMIFKKILPFFQYIDEDADKKSSEALLLLPEQGKVGGLVVLIHGFNKFGAWEQLFQAQRLSAKGCAVLLWKDKDPEIKANMKKEMALDDESFRDRSAYFFAEQIAAPILHYARP